MHTRSSTAQIRKKLASMHNYMRHAAKGDVVQLCAYKEIHLVSLEQQERILKT